MKSLSVITSIILLICTGLLLQTMAYGQDAGKDEGLFGDIYFPAGSATLSDEARKELAGFAEALKGRKDNVMLAGYSEPGEAREIAWKRAEAVKDYLVSMGLPQDSISMISFPEKGVDPGRGVKNNDRVRYREAGGGFQMPGSAVGGVCQKCKMAGIGGNR